MSKKEFIADTKYAISETIHLGGVDFVIAINDKGENPYCVATRKPAFFGYYYFDIIYTNDYLEALQLWNERIAEKITVLKTEISDFNDNIILDSDIVSKSEKNYEGKVVVLKPSSLSREYCCQRMQLYTCTGGNGADPDKIGTKVFLTSLYDDEHCTFQRSDILGVLLEEKVPDWAKEKINLIQEKYEKSILAKEKE